MKGMVQNNAGLSLQMQIGIASAQIATPKRMSEHIRPETGPETAADVGVRAQMRTGTASAHTATPKSRLGGSGPGRAAHLCRPSSRPCTGQHY